MGVYTKTVTYNILVSEAIEKGYSSDSWLELNEGYDVEIELVITGRSDTGTAEVLVNYYVIVPQAGDYRILSAGVKLIDPNETNFYYATLASGKIGGSVNADDEDIFFSTSKAEKVLVSSFTLEGSGSDLYYNGSTTLRYPTFIVETLQTSIAIESSSKEVIGLWGSETLSEELAFPVIYYPVIVSAPTTYLGDDMNITVTAKEGHSCSITYTFGDLLGTVTNSASTGTITWDIPTEDFLAQFSSTDIRKDGILSVRTIYNNEAIYTENIPFTILLDSSAGKPTISPTIVDTNSTTIALTGSANKIVKYYSNAQVTTGAKAQGAATLTSVKTVCGSKSFTGLSGTISGPDSNVFTITATDTRGLTSSYTETLSSSRFVDYSKLSCNLFTQPTTTDGKLTFIIEGNCFYGSFGAVSNTLTVQYRYKVKDGTYSSWTNASATLSSNSNYSKTITLTGLDYRTIYVIQARAIDKLATVQTSEVFSVGEPIFDWSKEDFNFNVPVSMQDSLTLAADKGIAGTTADGNEVIALMPCDSTGNTVLGYGNYTNEGGSTLIYGNASVDILSNGDITFNGQSLLGLVRAMSNSYTFTTTVTPGSNYNSASCALTLRGNCLYCRIYGSRAGASGTGDITDELIGKVSFNHGGKITGMDYVGAVSSQTGTTASIAMKNPSVSGDTATFDAYLTNSATAGTNFMATFVIPVSLNLNNF